MSYNVNAVNVLRENPWKRKAIGIAIAIVFLFLLEMFVIYNYISYTCHHPNSGLNAREQLLYVLNSVKIIFSKERFAAPFNAHTIEQMFNILKSLWLWNVLGLLLLSLSVRSIGNYLGVEFGSMRWATKKEKKDFSNSENTIPIQDNMYLNPQNGELKNLNEIVLGDTGALKTFRKLIPDILQCVGSYIITDTKGALFKQLYKFLKWKKYNIRVLNLIDLLHSNTYNPLKYVHTDEEIEVLVNTFIINSRKEGASTGEGIWEDTMSMVLTSIIDYLVLIGVNPTTHKKEDATFTRMLDLVVGLDVIGGEIVPYSEYEEIMKQIAMIDPMNSAVLNYKLFKKSAAETLQSILITVASRLRHWTTENIRILTQTDEMNIDDIAKEKTAIFIIIPDGENPYIEISSMFISQVFSRLYQIAREEYNGWLPNMVSCEFDEFANIGKIPKFEGKITTMRSRNIRCTLVVQNLQQLEQIYDKANKTIVSNCCVFNYLGVNDTDTRKRVVEMLDKTTIEERDTSTNTGNQGGGSESNKGIGRELLTLGELGVMKNKYSIVFIPGYYPFFGRKVRTEKHKYFYMLGNDKQTNNPNNTDIKQIYHELAVIHKQNYECYRTGNIEKLMPEQVCSVGDDAEEDGAAIEEEIQNAMLGNLQAANAHAKK